MKRLLEEARKMIRINSVSTSGNEELANYVTALMQDKGFKTQMQLVTHSNEDLSKRQFNAIGIMGDPLVDRKIRKGLLLNTHLDTVSPGLSENWTETGGDPFLATIKDGRIYGLGSADVKLDFLCKLHAAEKFREKKLKMPIYLVGSCGEEVGMFGTKYLIKSGSLNPKFVMIGEPSDLKVVYAHKCLNIYRVSIGFQLVERDARGFNRRIDFHSFGKSAHSSYPDMGVNAVLQAVEFLQKTLDHGFELRFTKIAGGDTINKVPDRSSIQFYVTSHQFEDFKRFFRDTVKLEGKERAFRVELGGVGDAGVRFLPDSLFPALTEVVRFFREMGSQFEKIKDTTYNPASSTINLGQIRQHIGGLDIHFDLRLLPDVSPEDVEKQIRQGIQAIAAKFPSLNLGVVRERMNPGLNMKLDDDLVRICRDAMEAAQIAPTFDKKATSTEAAQYYAAGYPAVVFGPGRSHGNSHSPNEHNIIEHLEKAIVFYERLIERVCL